MALNTHHEIPITITDPMQAGFTDAYNSEPEGGFFYRAGIDAILAHPDCIGLRYYFTYNGVNSLKVIMLGVEKVNYNDLYHEVIIIGNPQTSPETPVDQSIALDIAAGFTSNFRGTYAVEIGGFFFRSIIDYFLGVNDVIGLRYKFGLDTSRNIKLILNPVDSSFNDIVIKNDDDVEIKAEMSNGGGGGDADNPLVP